MTEANHHRCTEKECPFVGQVTSKSCLCHKTAEQMLSARIAALEEALREGVRAIGDHNAPHDCYATGPLTGDDYRDLVECPACAFLAKFEALSKET